MFLTSVTERFAMRRSARFVNSGTGTGTGAGTEAVAAAFEDAL